MGMLSRNKVIDALEDKRAKFEEYQAAQRSEFDLRQQLLARCLQMSAAEISARVAERATTLERALGRAVSWDEAAEVMANSFRSVFDLVLEQADALTAEETARAAQLREEQYAAETWNARF